MHKVSSHDKHPTVTPASHCFAPDCVLIALFVGGFALLGLVILTAHGVQLVNPNSLLPH